MAAAAKKAESKSDSEVRPAKGGYHVTAPLVAVKNDKGAVVHLFQGDVVPEGTQQESIDHLLDLEYISK